MSWKWTGVPFTAILIRKNLDTRESGSTDWTKPCVSLNTLRYLPDHRCNKEKRPTVDDDRYRLYIAGSPPNEYSIDISDSSSGKKIWTKENYKTADPNCNDYCAKKNMRCSFVNLRPLTYGCKKKLLSISRKTTYNGKTWTIKDYKTADPSCKAYCTKKNKKCSLVQLRPKILYGCK